MGQTIEIFERPAHDQAAGRRGPGQVLHRIVNLEHQGIGQPAHLFEATLGQDALLVGEMRFPDCDDGRAEEEKRDGRGYGQSDLVTADEFRGPIGEGVLPRDDGQTFEVSADIFGELADR